MENIAINDTIEFQLLETGVTSSSFKNCSYLGKVAYQLALASNPDINSRHNYFYPFFKDAFPEYKNPSDYQYIMVKLSNGVIDAIGVPWIIQSSLAVVTNQECVINISNYKGVMESPIKDLLSNLGASFTFQTKNR